MFNIQRGLALRVFFAVMLGLVGMASTSALASPGNSGSEPEATNQTAELCMSLDDDDDLTINAGEAEDLDVDLTGDGVVDSLDKALLIRGCGNQTSVGPGLTADVCVELYDAALIDENGTVVDATTFTAKTVAAGLSPAQIAAAAAGECGDLLPPALVETAVVTLDLTSADTKLENILPAGSTWTLTSTEDSTVTFAGTLAADLTLPSDIVAGNAVPFGEYTLTIDAASTFVDYEDPAITIDGPEETIDVELVPMTLVDQIVALLIEILEEILSETSTT